MSGLDVGGGLRGSVFSLCWREVDEETAEAGSAAV